MILKELWFLSIFGSQCISLHSKHVDRSRVHIITHIKKFRWCIYYAIHTSTHPSAAGWTWAALWQNDLGGGGALLKGSTGVSTFCLEISAKVDPSLISGRLPDVSEVGHTLLWLMFCCLSVVSGAAVMGRRFSSLFTSEPLFPLVPPHNAPSVICPSLVIRACVQK